MKTELNSRQWALYNYLKSMNDTWTTQYNVVKALNMLDGYYEKPELENFHDSPARHLLTKDIQAINASNIIQKIILSSPQGIKLASESDFEIYIRSQYAALWRKKKRLDKILKKADKDGQLRFTFGEERDTVKAFIDSDKAIGERLKDARLKSGWTAKKVVDNLKAGGITIDEPMLSRFEHGYCLPNKTTLTRLAVIYGISIEYILTGKLFDEPKIN